MPSGFKDVRRAGHRCVWCRKNHRKCDGQVPCSACKQRGLKCQIPQSLTDYTFVTATTNLKKPCSPLPALYINNWKYTKSFFDAASSSKSPLMRIFSFEKLTEHTHHDPLINALVCNLGSKFLSHTTTQALSRPSSQRVRSFLLILQDLRQQFYSQLQSADSTNLESMMVSASLLIMLEVAAGNKGPSWCYLVLSTRERILHRANHVSMTQFHQSLLSFIGVAEAVRSICLEEDMVASDQSTNFLDSDPSFITETSWSTEEQLEKLSRYLGLWARLEFWSLQWIRRSEAQNAGYKDEKTKTFLNDLKRSRSAMMSESLNESQALKPDQEHLMLGMKIINFATKLQQAIIATILSGAVHDQEIQTNENRTSPDSQLLRPYYHWALTGISQMFCHPAWNVLELGIPAMNGELLRDQAMQAFQCAEKHANHPEAIFFLPIINIIALEMKALEERERILSYVESLKRKGLEIASTVERDLPVSWRKQVGHY